MMTSHSVGSQLVEITTHYRSFSISDTKRQLYVGPTPASWRYLSLLSESDWWEIANVCGRQHYWLV